MAVCLHPPTGALHSVNRVRASVTPLVAHRAKGHVPAMVAKVAGQDLLEMVCGYSFPGLIRVGKRLYHGFLALRPHK